MRRRVINGWAVSVVVLLGVSLFPLVSRGLGDDVFPLRSQPDSVSSTYDTTTVGVAPGDRVPDDVDYTMTVDHMDIWARCDLGPRWHSVETLTQAIDRAAPKPGMDETRKRLDSMTSQTPMCAFEAASIGGEPYGPYAILLLGSLGDPRIFDILVKRVGDPSQYNRAAAIKALGNRGDVRAVPYLIAALDDLGGIEGSFYFYTQRVGQPEFPGLRGAYLSSFAFAFPITYRNARRAAQALGQLRDPRAVPVLLKLLQDDQCAFRDVVAGALGRIGDTSALPVLREMAEERKLLPWTRRAVRNIEARQKPEVALLADLRSEDSEVRGYAAMRLGEIGGVAAIPALRELSKDRTPFKTAAGRPFIAYSMSYVARQAIAQIEAREAGMEGDRGAVPAEKPVNP
jgi:HEAT repeat protein